MVIHNLGRVPTGPFDVTLVNALGTPVGGAQHPGLDGIEDLNDKKVAMTFNLVPRWGTVLATVRGNGKEITKANNRAAIAGHERAPDPDPTHREGR
ncbi:MAG: hypothetical protein QGI83_00945 [Candidatus Latescibacteria bacterium]|nr:hypothetical protein [Candidatus Latescibacterota bacterium]